MTSSAFAAGAYASAQSIGQGGLLKHPQVPGGDAGSGGVDFGSLVTQALDATAKAGAGADKQMANVSSGRSDVVDVVTAVAESEAAIETLVAVRDRMIAAYEEIMRMPV